MNLKTIELEFKSFCKLFYYFTFSMGVLEQLDGEISIFEILNQYRLKTLKNKDIEKIEDIKLYNFKVFKGLNTDLVFITFKIRPLDLNRIQAVFHPIDRSFRRYKVEFTKTERSLLFKLKNNSHYEYNHRDCISEAVQIGLDGEYSLSPLEETYKNETQSFETEYEFKARKKKEKWDEIKRKQSLRADGMKALRLWVKLGMPRLPRPEKKKQINYEKKLRKEKWKDYQMRESLGLLYLDVYGNLDQFMPVAPIKVPQRHKAKQTVFLSTEEIQKKEVKHLW